MNPFDLLGDADVEDPSLIVAPPQLKADKTKKTPAAAPAKTPVAKPAQLLSKPAPPTQAVRELRYESGREGGRGGGGGFGRGRRGNRDREFNRDSNDVVDSNGFSGGYKPSEEGERRHYELRGGYDAPRGGFRGGPCGGFSNGESGEGEGERPRRFYEREEGEEFRTGFRF